MQANFLSKYALNDLHESIDLFDRKIDYCRTHEKFECDEARDAALHKLTSKRGALVKAALALSALGVECDQRFLPRSFKLPAVTSEPAAVREPRLTLASRHGAPVIGDGLREKAAPPANEEGSRLVKKGSRKGPKLEGREGLRGGPE